MDLETAGHSEEQYTQDVWPRSRRIPVRFEEPEWHMQVGAPDGSHFTRVQPLRTARYQETSSKTLVRGPHALFSCFSVHAINYIPLMYQYVAIDSLPR